MKKRKFHGKLFFLMVITLIFFQWFNLHAIAAKPIRLVVDGKDITSLANPIIENGRTLVPIRFVAEELGAEVNWNDKDKKVTIEKDNQIIGLKIGSRLVFNQRETKTYYLSDITPKIIDGRTFVPLRLVSNALGIEIEWDEENRMINADSSKNSNIEPFFSVEFTTLNSGQVVDGKTNLQIEFSDENLTNAKEIKYLLLDPETAEGFVIARGKDITGKYTWIANLQDKGEKVLVAGIYDNKGQFLAGDAISIYLDVEPKVSLTGVTEGEVLSDTISLGADINFTATNVKYEITNLDNNETKIIGEDIPQDPYGEYRWDPQLKENGNYSFKVIAYDSNNRSYESQKVLAKVEVKPKLALSGIVEGQIINKPVNLLASRNFDVTETQYIMRDTSTGKEEILAKIPYGGYRWFPGPELSGEIELFTRVKDIKGVYHESEAKKVDLPGEPIVLLEGVGPNQVLKDSIKIKTESNVTLDSVSYVLINQETGKQKIIDSDVDPLIGQEYAPTKEDVGYWNIKAIGKVNGKQVSSEEIPIRVYLGETYKSLPIIEKDKFLNLASELAKDSWDRTGMSAALQTAQSILETGWGQSVPVDKYSGKLSYNLFGIKGKGPQGSVTYNTWEVYNGQTYHVDAEFRAYNNVEESWADHKDFLLNSTRYEPFKEVMHNSTQGAWALKRTGYATDPEYAIKLMKIIKQYELEKLDKVSI
ncbi:stalk domain-containing protein [Schnuerera sp.]|uniref:stalk domain-containing protein n=1 Tax=Schnuerera sp. TaxID=2794844 RepID=UPI002CECB98B|nr:glucosaminidase domain-containing protein [Schnuerera sp.]HSH35368.1 glucosaminidase domain-containing protein [Schnuerera sp.]